MINDQSSGVGAMLETSRLQGVARGTPNGELILDRVMSDEKVTTGENVLSSGGDQIFPKGLPVGTVSQVSPGREMFLSIKVKPTADLSRLEEVLVVTEKQERAPVAAESGGRVRAADILAQRLPSVPDKPPEVAGASPAGTAASGATGEAATGAGEKPQAHDAVPPLTGTGTTVEVVKKVTPKPATGDSATNGGARNETGSSPALRATSAGSSPTPKSATSPTKPAMAPPKPSNKAPTPQPATEDSPH
jgi:rod shape-determining protein MreC